MQPALILVFSLLVICLQLVREVTASAHNAVERRLMRSMTATSDLSSSEGRVLRPMHNVDVPDIVNNPPQHIPPLNRPFEEDLSGMILGESASLYLEFQDDAADASDNRISTTIVGDGTYVDCSTTGMKAARFGPDMNRVDVTNAWPINLRSMGYLSRTIEMWFVATALPPPFGAWKNNMTLYEEGGNATGIHIYVGCCDENETKATLYMFMWNHGDNQSSELYGTDDVDPEPITCQFAKDEPHYLAFIFEGNASHEDGNRTPHYSAYMGWPNGEEGVKLCGTQYMGMSALKNNTWRSNIKLPLHEGTIGVGGISGDTMFNAQTTCESNCDVHDFNGVIDELAIYNTALTDLQLEAHFHAGKIGGVCLPSDLALQ